MKVRYKYFNHNLTWFSKHNTIKMNYYKSHIAPSSFITGSTRRKIFSNAYLSKKKKSLRLIVKEFRVKLVTKSSSVFI